MRLLELWRRDTTSKILIVIQVHMQHAMSIISKKKKAFDVLSSCMRDEFAE